MNSAPAVQYPVGRSVFQGYFLLTCSLAGFLVGGMWASATGAFLGPQIFFFIVLSAVLSLAGLAWHQTEAGHLVWGGESWTWTVDRQSTAGAVAVHFDSQMLMVMTLQPEKGGPVWLWAERNSDPVRWRALRRAVYADHGTTVHAKSEGSP
ncbi:hypothetical protein [Rhodoferax sp. PAMC 29310]|uniref:hypothetical protein n=1 Tax=Rhodoferax sp. PAMC 29310 TaxID=2822760 RepID=UPI001B31BE1C|nr:hypothetical protein [Rhodoferax sp. PAMC 29310]